jgi:hypothetical protein
MKRSTLVAVNCASPLATAAEQAGPRDQLSRIVVRFNGVQGFATAAKAELAGIVLSTAKNDLSGGAFSPFNARLKRPCPKVADETRKRLRAGMAVYDLHEPRKMLALNQGSRGDGGIARNFGLGARRIDGSGIAI